MKKSDFKKIVKLSEGKIPSIRIKLIYPGRIKAFKILEYTPQKKTNPKNIIKELNSIKHDSQCKYWEIME